MTTSNTNIIELKSTHAVLEAVTESDGSEGQSAEENPLIQCNRDSYHHNKTISPILQSDSIPLRARSLKTASNKLHYFTAKQLVEHIDLNVMSYVTHHNNITHNPDALLSSPDIKRALHKLRTLLLIQNIDTHDTESTDTKTHIQCVHNNSADITPDLPVPKYVQSSDSELPSISLTHSVSNDLPQIIQISSSDDNHFTKDKWCTHSVRSQWPQCVPSSALLHHPLYSINKDKYCGKLRGSVRQDWNTIETDDDEERNWEELKPHWFELFFDLMFVAAIVHISAEVADAYAHHQYIFIYTVFPQFGLLVLCWLQHALYQSRFRMTQTGDGLLQFFYMSVVLLMGLSIGNMRNETSQNLFLVSYMLTKIIMCIMFIKSSLIPRAHAHSVYMLIENIVSIIAIIAIVVYVETDDIEQYDEWKWFWCLIYSLLFVYSWIYVSVLVYAKCIRDFGVNIPINVPHIAERMGAFVLIILGETIISIMVQHVESTTEGILTAYGVTISLFIIVYCIGKLYFESQPSEHELHHHKKSHAMSFSVWRARIYKWFHIVLFFGLLGLGLGCKIAVHEMAHYDMHEATFIFIPGISCIVICCAINIIRLTHPFDYSENSKGLVIFVWVVRVLCMMLMLGILFAWQIVHHFIIMSVYVICFVIQVIVDFEARKRLFMAQAADKDKSFEYYNRPKLPRKVTSTKSFNIGAF